MSPQQYPLFLRGAKRRRSDAQQTRRAHEAYRLAQQSINIVLAETLASSANRNLNEVHLQFRVHTALSTEGRAAAREKSYATLTCMVKSPQIDRYSHRKCRCTSGALKSSPGRRAYQPQREDFTTWTRGATGPERWSAGVPRCEAPLVAGGGLAALSLVGCGGDDDDDSAKTEQAGTRSARPDEGRRGRQDRHPAVRRPGRRPRARSRSATPASTRWHASPTTACSSSATARRPSTATTSTPQPDLAQAMPEQPAGQPDLHLQAPPGEVPQRPPVTSRRRQVLLRALRLRRRLRLQERLHLARQGRDAGPADRRRQDEVPLRRRAAELMTVRNDGRGPRQGARGEPGAREEAHGHRPLHLRRVRAAGRRPRYKRNPDYHRQPYPYFDEIDFLGTSDPVKKIADFIAQAGPHDLLVPGGGARPDEEGAAGRAALAVRCRRRRTSSCAPTSRRSTTSACARR